MLAIKKGDIVVDGTLGGGGHSEYICSLFGRNITLIGLDRDEDAIVRSEARLQAAGCAPYLVHANFEDIDRVLESLAIKKVDKVLLDLGLSSFQIDVSGRGFSFLRDEPLRMTMNKEVKEGDTTAEDVVNEWEESSLADVIYGYGEERYARRIARAIVEARNTKPIRTTTDLVTIIKNAVPATYRRGKIHPATRTFQALRIAVNNELESLKVALEKTWNALSQEGRISVITFHSLEDRIVKRYFKELTEKKVALLINKKPIIPTEEEIASNPRSRSAKLRVIQKL